MSFYFIKDDITNKICSSPMFSLAKKANLNFLVVGIEVGTTKCLPEFKGLYHY